MQALDSISQATHQSFAWFCVFYVFPVSKYVHSMSFGRSFYEIMSVLCLLQVPVMGLFIKDVSDKREEVKEKWAPLQKWPAFSIKSLGKGERSQTFPKNPDIFSWWSKLKLIPWNSYFSVCNSTAIPEFVTYMCQYTEEELSMNKHKVWWYLH